MLSVSSNVAVPSGNNASSAWTSYLHACVPHPATVGKEAGLGVVGARDHEVDEGCSLPHVLSDLQTSVWIQAGLAGKLGSCMLFALSSVGKRRNGTVVCRGLPPYGF